MKLPRFLVVGALKSATTSLYYYLYQHPDVFLSSKVKESRFLVGLTPEKNPEMIQDLNYIASFDAYKQLFESATSEQVIGEVDPWYLYLYEQTIPRIKAHLDPDVCIIMCLRNPVDRCYSHYYQVIKQGWKVRAFEETLDVLLGSEQTTWYERAFLEAGLYYKQVKAYLDVFTSEQVLIYLLDELRYDSIPVIRDICQFIGVDDTFVPNMSERVNIGGIPKNRALYNFIKKPGIVAFIIKSLIKPFMPALLRKRVQNFLIQQNLRSYPAMKERERRRLMDYYREDVLSLQSLIDKDLSSWLRYKKT